MSTNPIPAWVNYHHLYYFMKIVEEGTVSKAAIKLKIGQPTLSAQLKSFENTLGIQLFDRKHKKLLLTEQGKVAFDYAKSIFKMGSEMLEVLHDRIRPSRLSLHLGALDSIPKQIVLQAVQFALRSMPCQITLTEGRADELMRELSAHRIDLIFTNFLPMGLEAKGLFPRLITRKNVCFYGSEKFKHLRKDFPRSISGQPLVVPTQESKLRSDLEHWANLNKLELNIVVESQEISLKKLLAARGLALLPTATHTVTRQILNGELSEIGTVQGVSEELYLVSAQRKIPNPVAAKLMELFKV